MQDIYIVLQRDFRELRQSGAFRILVIISAAVSVAGAIGFCLALSSQPWLSEKLAAPVLELIIGVVCYFVPLFILMAFIWASASLPIVKEKVNGNIESLLATPLSPQSIWMAKGLAIFLPGYVISVIATLIILLPVNFAVIAPSTGGLILPAPALLISLLINPLLLFGLLSFIVLFSLANNPDIAIAPSFLVGFGLMIGILLGIILGAINPASWTFALWYLAGTAVSWAIVGCLSRLLTKENIVLSSKGD